MEEILKKENKLIGIFYKNDDIYNWMKKRHINCCNIIINSMIDKYYSGKHATPDELEYFYHLYDTESIYKLEKINELMTAFHKNDKIYYWMKKQYRDCCSNGDIMINSMIEKYYTNEHATPDELEYFYHLYDTYKSHINDPSIPPNPWWAD